MNAREVIVLALTPFSHLPERDASYVIGTLKENGFTIMSKEDVEAVREKALEEAAGIGPRILIPADKWGDRKEAETFNAAVEQYALEIRSLKSKEGKVDS